LGGSPKSALLSGTLDVQTPAIDNDGSMYLGDDYGYLYRYGPTFVRQWREDLGYTRVYSSPSIGADGAIYVHTDDGYLSGYFSDGTLKWRVAIPGESYSSVSIGSDGMLYLGSEDENLYALSPLDGAVKWKFKAEGEIFSSPAIDDAGNLYFGSFGSQFYSVTKDGTLRWKYPTGGKVSSSPAIGADGTLYFGCYDANVYALKPDGTLKWKYLTGDEIRASSPAVAGDGTIYIGSYDGFLHAINTDGTRKRVYATGGYIRSSPLIEDRTLFFGSSDGRTYATTIDVTSAVSPWPLHRQNSRRTGRRLVGGEPRLIDSPVSQVVAAGAGVTLAVNSEGAGPLTFQWQHNGVSILGATHSTYAIPHSSSTDTGSYTVVVTNSLGSVTAAPIVVGLSSTAKVVGAGSEIGTDIRHPNGNTFDQVLLQGTASSVTADAGQVLRISFVDPNDDIVQVEFAGAGTLSIVLDAASGPATPVKYNQTVAYMKGRAGIVITGANETTNVSVFSVGRATAFDPTGGYNILQAPSATNDPTANGSSLFVGQANTTYDGLADIAYISIQSTNGKFGGVRTANATYSATQGLTGLYAPDVQFSGPIFISDINAASTATPVLVIGGTTGETRITGGDLKQDNGRPVRVSGLTQLRFANGSTSHGELILAKVNQARLEENGSDVTARTVVNPTP
jgi:outer membrane protein assembly factor BamB